MRCNERRIQWVDRGYGVLITAEGGWRGGNIVALKRVAEEALAGCPGVRHVVVVHRGVMDAAEPADRYVASRALLSSIPS
jgi:acyl-coenzyme A synthetase/AMP-(fatty) acid ligase